MSLYLISYELSKYQIGPIYIENILQVQCSESDRTISLNFTEIQFHGLVIPLL